jgi:hypothetical protein
MAFLADLAFAYIGFYTLLSFQVYERKYLSLSRMIGMKFDLSSGAEGLYLSQGIATVIFVFAIYLLLRFYMTLILGVSLSQWLLGLRGIGTKSWKRIGGGARVVLEAFLSPLLIFDFFLLFKRPSLKESLSHTRVYNKGGKLSLYLGLVWVSALLLFSTVSPLLEGLKLVDGIVLNPVTENLDLKDEGSLKDFKEYSSNRFKFKSLSSLSKGRFIFLPSFEFIKRGANNPKINAYLTVYDKETNVDALIKVEQRFSLIKLLEGGKIGNPFFSSQFPSLAKGILEPRESFFKRKYQASYGTDKILRPKMRLEMERLIRASLSLGSSTLIGHLLTFGPFYRGFVKVRSSLLKKALNGVPPEIDFGKIGNYKFLRYKQLFEENIILDKKMVETYLPIETNNSVALRFYWGGGLQSALSRKNFRKSFLQGTLWYFDYFNMFEYPKRSDDINSLTVFDHFIKKSLTAAEREMMEEAVYRIYFKTARRALQAEDNKLQDLLFDNLNRLFLVAAHLNKETKKRYYSEKFLVHLKDLRISIRKKNLTYFGLVNR